MRELLICPDARLRKTSHKIEFFSNDLVDLEAEMREVMGDNVGLAAVQIGMPLRVILVRDTYMINPRWSPAFGCDVQGKEEGCMSMPNRRFFVPRYTSVQVSYKNVDDVRMVETLYDWDARILQHECDHLDGILISDYVRGETHEFQ